MVRVLGPVELVTGGGETVDLPSPSQRRLLAALALQAPQPVRAEWLCSVLEVTPGALRTAVTRLRRVLGEGLLHTSATGYRLEVPVDAALACEELQAAGGDPVAISLALERWVGPALDEFADEPWAVGDAARLREVRATAVEDLAAAWIADGRVDEAIARLEPHLIEHPYRDRPRGLMMRGLAAAGRTTEALRVYQTYRAQLGDAVGTEPSEELRGIEQRIAAGWDGIDSGADGSDRRDAPNESWELAEVLAAAPPLVGRRAEREELAVALERARQPGPAVVLLSGEAGIGKTTLVAAFAREHCVPAGWNVVYGRCDETVIVPFQPFRDVLGRIVDHLPDDALMAHTASCGNDLLRLLPQMGTRVPSTGVASDEITARHLLFEAVVDVVRRAAEMAPIVMVLDDLHWADLAALQLLRHLLRSLAGVPVLFVVGFRDTGEGSGDELRSVLADLARSDVTRVELDGLDPAELAELVKARVAGASGHDVGPLVARLSLETAGNPLFAEHLVRHWVRSEQLSFADRSVGLTSVAATEMPSTLRDLVWHRIAPLGDDGASVLGAAAVLGVQFDEGVLAATVDIDDDHLAKVLDSAVLMGVLAEPAARSGSMRFTHALVARSLLAELGTRARRRLHARAFDALLSLVPDGSPERAPGLVHHAELAGRPDEAMHWAGVAGDQALANLAPDEAAAWFRKALDHATELGLPEPDRADLLVRLGEAEHRAGTPTALETISAGAELAERCEAGPTLVRAALATDRGWMTVSSFAPKQLAIVEAALARIDDGDPDARARVLALLAQSLVHTDQADRRTAAALEALDLARASADPLLVARVAPDILYALWAPGSAELRGAVAAEAAAIADEASDPHLAFVVSGAAYNVAVCRGDAAQAMSRLARMRAIADEIGEPRMVYRVGIENVFEATMGARFAEAEALIAANFELGAQIGEPDAFTVFASQTFAMGTFAGRHAELRPIIQSVVDTGGSVELALRIAHAIVCCEDGEPDVAVALLREGLDRGLNAIPHDFVRSTSVIGYAVLTLDLEDADAAAVLYPEIAGMAGEVSFSGVTSQGPIAAYAGKLATLLGMHDEAERFLLDALATTEAFGWQYHRATTLIALAHNRVRRNGHLNAEALSWLITAEHLCETHGIASWARRARVLRTQLPG
jgi:DNA-binding SARP family transcriptional activator